ncbi:hypothetical protein EVAR_57926_1 [Eumeta japonica]|uniref:Uncharacterized protein n=1 Tax=Eumeta variegata TaxID=151549 RepID=A0A4C1ZM28_EUMVA|nr:hypothetical protein EVAR_57926_1 [Eumeta japonica]
MYRIWYGAPRTWISFIAFLRGERANGPPGKTRWSPPPMDTRSPRSPIAIHNIQCRRPAPLTRGYVEPPRPHYGALSPCFSYYIGEPNEEANHWRLAGHRRLCTVTTPAQRGHQCVAGLLGVKRMSNGGRVGLIEEG